MSIKARLYDFRVSDGPTDLGVCVGDVPQCAAIANSAQRRLIMCREAGEEGWLGCFAEMAFTLSQATPYLTTPRSVARLEAIDVCDRPISLSNQFYEYLRYGNGRMPKLFRQTCKWPLTAAYTRNNVPTFVDLTNPPQFIAVYAANPADVQAAKRVFLQGVDNTGSTIYSQDQGNNVTGQFLTLTNPYVQSPMQFSSLTGIQKDITDGPIQIFQVDPNTGTQVLLSTMDPGEQVASYRRYYFDQLPRQCCFSGAASPIVTITAIVKLEPIPLAVDTDEFLLAGDAVIEAITEEAFANRYRKMDTAEAKSMAAQHHKSACGILNGILVHYLGKDSPAVQFAPFGSARLSRLRVGMI